MCLKFTSYNIGCGLQSRAWQSWPYLYCDTQYICVVMYLAIIRFLCVKYVLYKISKGVTDTNIMCFFYVLLCQSIMSINFMSLYRSISQSYKRFVTKIVSDYIWIWTGFAFFLVSQMYCWKLLFLMSWVIGESHYNLKY